MTSAGALCDDKICKLCGVEVESIVQAEETLQGVELKRKVVERCRMIRTAEPEVTRKSVDCGPKGCTAWLQIRYTDDQKEESCKRLEDGHFAGPEACQAAIEAFSKVPGYGAASFRTRVKAIDQALVDCADIDVRPTPLMGSLDAKLKGGMSVFNRAESDAPSFLKSYWLAPDPPLWKRYEEEPKFVPRLQLLRGYLAHKVLIMDVVEASQPEDLDTKEAVARIARTCEAVSPNEAYGVEQAQRIAIEALYDRWFTHRFTAAVTPVSRVIMKQYPPEAATPELAMAISGLFAIGDRLDADEWGWLVRTPTTGPAMRRGLEVRDHGKPETRRARLREALERTLAGAESKVRPRRFEHVFPSDGTFLLSVEAELPADLKAHLDWEFLKELFERSERRMTHAEAQAYLDRMAVALRALPVDAKARRARCTGLADDLKFLWQHDRPTDTFGETVCACLTDGLGDDSLTLVNKHDLYERALGEKLACVAPLP